MYQHNFPQIKHHIRHNGGNREDAEDVFQEGLVILYEAILDDRFRRESSINTYLFAICKNLWVKRLNKRNISKAIEVPMESPGNPSYDGHKLQILLDHMNESCKKLLVSFYYFNQSMAEIKSLFGLKSEQAAKNKKRNCMKTLIQMVKEKELTIDQFIVDEY